MTIYELDGDDLSPLEEVAYGEEADLQSLLAQHPGLLAGDQPATGERWLLVDTEVGLGDAEDASNRWYIDNLFLSREGIPTLVEVKMSSNPAIRREIVGQMLDYAANAVVYWKLDRLQACFDARCEQEGLEPDEHLVDSLGLTISADTFWSMVKTNLSAGRLRLVFVADSIPPELQRIVEFLNGQMLSCEILALEVRRIGDPENPTRLLTSRTIGQTLSAAETKSGGRTPTASKGGWDPDSVLSDLRRRKGERAHDTGSKLYDWALEERPAVTIDCGSGKQYGSIKVYLSQGEQRTALFYLYSNGRVEVPFQYLRQHPGFESSEDREQLRSLLNMIPGVAIAPEKMKAHPSFEIGLLEDDLARSKFLETVEWMMEHLDRHREG